MKKMIVLIGCLFLLSCSSQNIVHDNCRYQKEKNIEAKSDIIYQHSIEWLNMYYNHTSDIYKHTKNNQYKILCKKVLIDDSQDIHCSIKIDIKNNKFKITYKDIVIRNGKEISQILLKKLEPKFNTAIFNLCEKIKAG